METRNTQKPLGFSALIPCSIIAAGAAILAYQGYFWFMRGYWKPLKTWLLFDKFLPAEILKWHRNCNSAAFSKAVAFTSNLPLAWFLIISGFLLLLLAARVFSYHYTTNVEPAEGDYWRR